MSALADLFELAVRHHQSGELAQAEPLYRQVLQANPAHADALHHLGIIAHQTGNGQAAIDLIRQAISLVPTAQADAHNNLGIACRATGQLAEAMKCYRSALQINPDHADALNNLGSALIEQGEPAEARACCQRALAVNPNHADARTNLGNTFFVQGMFAEAAACYRQALQINPNHAHAYYNLGNALKDLGQTAEAAKCYRQALRINANFVEAHNNLGTALALEGERAEAAECFRQVLNLYPQHADAHNNLGNILTQQGRLTEATASYQQALRLRPNYAAAYRNLGMVLVGQRRLVEAADAYRQALSFDPGDRTALVNRGLLRLLQGDLEGGWPDYEQRLAQPGLHPRPFQEPRWDGSPLAGKSILVYAEQGLGDTIQFMRYLPLVKKQGGTVILECQAELAQLLAGARGMDELFVAGATLPAFDVQIPLMSLPGVFHSHLATIPADVPYLQTDPKLVAYWQQELSGLHGLKVGIAWQGNPKVLGDRLRSIPLEYFEPLTGVSEVKLVSLQKRPGADQLRAKANRWPILDLGDRLETFSDTAAVMNNLDLIITSDTSVPHLAGALGVRVWTVLQLSPDWRWLLDREDSPWYPTMRLFRQRKLGDWREVFERVAEELKKRSEESGVRNQE